MAQRAALCHTMSAQNARLREKKSQAKKKRCEAYGETGGFE